MNVYTSIPSVPLEWMKGWTRRINEVMDFLSKRSGGFEWNNSSTVVRSKTRMIKISCRRHQWHSTACHRKCVGIASIVAIGTVRANKATDNIFIKHRTQDGGIEWIMQSGTYRKIIKVLVLLYCFNNISLFVFEVKYGWVLGAWCIHLLDQVKFAFAGKHADDNG